MTDTAAGRSSAPFGADNLTQPWRRNARRLVTLAIAALLLLTVLACGGSVSEPAPDFSFTLFQGSDSLPAGEELRLSDLKGRPVVLNFWAGLCPPCRAEMPDLQAFYDERQDDVTLIGVDIGQFMGLGSQADAENLLRELNITYPAGFTNDSNIIRAYKVLGMPTTVFINPDGSIFEPWTGVLNQETLEKKVQEMLAQQG